MAEFNIEQAVKKVPPWGWVAVVAGIGIVLYLQNQQSSAPAAAAAGSTATDTSGGNTSTPAGQLCPSYSVPVCLPPGVIIYEADETGCPKPVCSSSLGGSTGGSTGSPGTTGSSSSVSLCHSSPFGGHCTVGRDCPGNTFREIFTAVGQNVNCALQWNPTGAYLGLDRALWTSPVPFVVYY